MNRQMDQFMQKIVSLFVGLFLRDLDGNDNVSQRFRRANASANKSGLQGG